MASMSALASKVIWSRAAVSHAGSVASTHAVPPRAARVRSGSTRHGHYQGLSNVSSFNAKPLAQTVRGFKPLKRGTGFLKVEATSAASPESTFDGGATLLTVSIENSGDGVTRISISGIDKGNLLVSVSTALNSMGLNVVNASITTKTDTNEVFDYFTVTDEEGNQLDEEMFPMLQEHIMQTCLQTYKSSTPAIYGVAAAAEARWIRSTANASQMYGGQGAARNKPKDNKTTSEAAAARSEAAAALELAAAEMAQAAAVLVSMERFSAELALELEGKPEDEALQLKMIAQEEARLEASAVLERRMAAMEAALASRRQLKMELQEISVPEPSPEEVKREPAFGGAPVPDFMQPPPTVGTGPGSGQGYEIFLQGFNWEACQGVNGVGWYHHLTSRIDELADAGYTSIWLPPPTASVSDQGYLPTDLYDLDSKYGSEQDLIDLNAKMHTRNMKSMVDTVINHRCASGQDSSGRWNQFGGRMAWNEQMITCDTPEWGGKGNPGTGDEYAAAPNIDHKNETVRAQLKEWMRWLRETIGIDGFRFDFVLGYAGKYTQEYVDAAVPRLSVGEFWDACDYSDGVLAYNQGGMSG
mmetsp:Transcript_14532/g.31123  ORF Transcript_14532/g.31123 Transcript_14532/m.31123 type:complete len:586 (-) Transcript_14532:7-1764(-)